MMIWHYMRSQTLPYWTAFRFYLFHVWLWYAFQIAVNTNNLHWYKIVYVSFQHRIQLIYISFFVKVVIYQCDLTYGKITVFWNLFYCLISKTCVCIKSYKIFLVQSPSTFILINYIYIGIMYMHTMIWCWSEILIRFT